MIIFPKMKSLYLFVIALLFTLSAKSQIFAPVKWSYATRLSAKTTATVFIKATIDKGWHIYALRLPEGGPKKTTIRFAPSKNYKLISKMIEPKAIRKYDESFHMNVDYYEKSVVFQQKININSGQTVVKGSISFMSCDAKRCLPEETVNFSIPVKG